VDQSPQSPAAESAAAPSPGAKSPGAEPGSAFDTIRVDREGALCWLTLDRPGQGNALSPHVLDEIDQVLAQLTTDLSVKVLIIRGSGKGFCAGHELGRARGPENVSAVLGRMNRTFDTFRRIWELPRPVIASVHGYCIGAATQLAAACDLVAVSTDVQVGLPKLPMGAGLTPPMLALSIGVRRARLLAYDIGSTMDGPAAVAAGWANFHADPDALDAEVTALARRIARSPVEVLAGQKASLNKVAELQGFWLAATSGVELDAMHHFAHTGEPTSRAIREHGVRGALELFDQGLLGAE
jgi:enoyl-CoA hydratase/carnithine racemase